MRTIWLLALAAFCASPSKIVAQPTTSGTSESRQAAGAAAGFPSYSRQEETESCLFGYGTENSSILDCVARDEDFRNTLSKKWADLDDHFKTDCVHRLATRHLNSYYYLDRCIKSAKQQAATPD